MSAPDSPRPSRRRRPGRRLCRTALLFGGALFANELWCNVEALMEQLGGAKVMRSVSSGFDRVLLDTAGALAWMLLLALLLSLAVGAAWRSEERRVGKGCRVGEGAVDVSEKDGAR